MDKNIIQKIEEIQVGWFGNIIWRENKTYNKENFNWIPSGRRKRGKPNPMEVLYNWIASGKGKWQTSLDGS